jgi:hypothetical protein
MLLAEYCETAGVGPDEIRALRNLVERYHRAEVALNLAGDETKIRQLQLANGARLAHDRADAYAKQLGFEVSWPGTIPVLKKNGHEFYSMPYDLPPIK